jgi:hypothetical protein
MNQRAQAIDILQRARDELAERLTERILDAEQQILDDARGERYLSEIETLYDELGARLAHVNSMLAQLLPVDEPENPEDTGGAWAGDDPDWTSALSTAAFSRGGRLALPPPNAPAAVPADPAPDLHAFLRNVQRGDLCAAAARLAVLFELNTGRAQRCADVFAVQAALRGELYTRVMRLKGELERGAVDDARLLLYDCFGLEPLETAAVIKTLLRRLGLAANAQVW